MARFVPGLRPLVLIVAALAALTAALAPLLDEGEVAVVSLTYLLLTLVASARWGYAAGFASAVLSNLLVNFFFVPPLHRFHVANVENVAALAVFLAVAFVGSYMLSRLREQAARAEANRAEIEVLLEAIRDVAAAGTPAQALNRLCEASARTAGARGCALLAGDPPIVLASTIDERSSTPPTRDEAATALEALRRNEPAWLSTDDSRAAGATFVPLGAGSSAVLRFSGKVAPARLRGPLFEGLANEFRSVLDRRRLAAEAGRAEELQRSDAFKSLLLSSASHDLRTPLTAVKAAISSLRDDSVAWTKPDTDAFLETIESQTDRLTGTLNNLLEMSRVESGSAQAKVEPIEVAPLLAEAAITTSHATAGREVFHESVPDLWVRADYGLLMQALTNLIENAARYSTPGTPIRLDGTCAPGRVFLSVRDCGPQIDQAELPLLFEKFYRGKSAGETRGTGLGLALVKAIVEAAHGSVAATSGPEGTAITLSLPAAKAPR